MAHDFLFFSTCFRNNEQQLQQEFDNELQTEQSGITNT